MPPHETTPTTAPWTYIGPPTATLEEPTIEHDLFSMMDFGVLDDVVVKKPENKPKAEKRKLQVREASRRCRLKQKEEVVYLRGRVAELEQLLRDQTMVPCAVSSNSIVNEVIALRQQNKQLVDALQRSQSQMALIQALLNKNMLDAMQTITQTTVPLGEQDTVLSSCTELEKKNIYDVVDSTVVSLTSLPLPNSAPLVSIQRSNNSWFGDVWLCDTSLIISMEKEWSLGSSVPIDSLAERIWTRSAASSFADDNYTLIHQELCARVDENTHIIRRVESLIEMKVLEQSSIKFRRKVNASTITVGFVTYQSGSALKYTAGKERLAIVLFANPQTLQVTSVKIVGSYDVAGVPSTEVASRMAKHVLNLAHVLETRLLV